MLTEPCQLFSFSTGPSCMARFSTCFRISWAHRHSPVAWPKRSFGNIAKQLCFCLLLVSPGVWPLLHLPGALPVGVWPWYIRRGPEPCWLPSNLTDKDVQKTTGMLPPDPRYLGHYLYAMSNLARKVFILRRCSSGTFLIADDSVVNNPTSRDSPEIKNCRSLWLTFSYM